MKRSVRRSVLGAAGIAAVLATAIIWPFNSPVTSGASLAFEATFDTSADFYGRFDYGYSGLNPLATATGRITAVPRRPQHELRGAHDAP